ncbi:glycosyl hydrolase 108 family protein [Sphingomonas morindae]|uniref:Uncharacterized protein n=1 Tax=Sphingomonas morindae TaxID=1541170 RepID=A0ABY4XA46_9SPHN|nr:glycosyl hydrolase 108 family protein [Sphingomonas morindae]USI73793.1 hypothetical protein LHA26_04815 [Sphingomonas morindae]
MDPTHLIDALIAREGDYVDHPADAGGPTRYGITEAQARAAGWTGSIRALPRATAAALYAARYWHEPGFDRVAERAPRLAAELFDTGVNMGPLTAIALLRRVLRALNRQGRDFADPRPRGPIDRPLLAAIDAFLRQRGAPAETVLIRALDALQGARYVALAERRPANELFLYGWLANRVGGAR